MSLIANARMYAVTPGVREAWRTLFDWVARTSGVPLEYIDHAAPAPLETLWAREDLGATFMCGFPFASAARKPGLIAAPVPSPSRYGGLPRYCTDFIVRADHPFARLSDTFGGRIGWTVGHSQSGYNAVRYHLSRYRREQSEPLFAHWVGPLITPRRVIEHVITGKIDVGPLDSYVHDLLKRNEPETASRLRTIESTAMTPIPPLVVSTTVAGDTVERLRGALISGAIQTELAATFDVLVIKRFAPVKSSDYAVLLSQAREADRQGIATPGPGLR
ncbi:MAG TPA: PhnD/SsuA/transferrin family substrate-binding protein [Xanthobacteraceae bacterium]|nr:PhnD/SsuA/transferrin family substrate-binding protein [Xanthobacteraceae bacterium]